MVRKPVGYHTEGSGAGRVVHPHFARGTPDNVKSKFMHPTRVAMHQTRGNHPSYRVVYLEKMPWPSYIGMNWYAARKLGLVFPYSRNTIVIENKLRSITKSRILRHELYEMKLMKNSNMSYQQAHKQTIDVQGECEGFLLS